LRLFVHVQRRAINVPIRNKVDSSWENENKVKEDLN